MCLKKKYEIACRQDVIGDANNTINCPQYAAFIVANGAVDCGKSICPYLVWKFLIVLVDSLLGRRYVSPHLKPLV